MQLVFGLLVILVLLALIGFGIALLQTKLIRLYPLMVGVVVVVLGGFLVYHCFFYYDREQIRISIMDGNETMFVLPIKNRTIDYEYTSAEIVTNVNMGELADVITETYPNSKITQDEDYIKVTFNNQVIIVQMQDNKQFIWDERYVYSMTLQSLGLEIEPERFIDIPFPKEYLVVDGMYQKEMELECGMDELNAFYEDFDNVSIVGNIIIIRQKGTIQLIIQDNKVIISVIEP